MPERNQRRSRAAFARAPRRAARRRLRAERAAPPARFSSVYRISERAAESSQGNCRREFPAHSGRTRFVQTNGLQCSVFWSELWGEGPSERWESMSLSCTADLRSPRIPSHLLNSYHATPYFEWPWRVEWGALMDCEQREVSLRIRYPQTEGSFLGSIEIFQQMVEVLAFSFVRLKVAKNDEKVYEINPDSAQDTAALIILSMYPKQKLRWELLNHY